MEIAAEVWFWVGPKATGTARFGREPRRQGACIKGGYPTNASGTCRSADGPVAFIALANQKGDAVRRSALASGASEVGTADCIRHVYPAWRANFRKLDAAWINVYDPKYGLVAVPHPLVRRNLPACVSCERNLMRCITNNLTRCSKT